LARPGVPVGGQLPHDADRVQRQSQWLPHTFGLFSNISSAWTGAELGASFLNSLGYAIVCGTIAVMVATLAAFGVAVVPCKHPMVWFWFIYSGTLLSLQIFLAPLFQTYATTGCPTPGWDSD